MGAAIVYGLHDLPVAALDDVVYEVSLASFLKAGDFAHSRHEVSVTGLSVQNVNSESLIHTIQKNQQCLLVKVREMDHAPDVVCVVCH